jgi:hypothetical protein
MAHLNYAANAPGQGFHRNSPGTVFSENRLREGLAVAGG